MLVSVDEIRQLQQSYDDLWQETCALREQHSKDLAEIERLRAALKPLADLAGLGGCIVEGKYLEQARLAYEQSACQWCGGSHAGDADG